ncbi:MAG: Delta-aminolevulinic acid dehydratase [Candidatus Omnitrophica bacterium]|nr:Delta-aminolevulinic acid dehydratase [Candidatus Omnitrophota bacterium]
MPGQFQLSQSEALKECELLVKAGVPAVILFGLPAHKDEAARSAYDDDGVVQNAVRAIKRRFPSMLVITDVCLCEYHSHGHCGHVDRDGRILNDPTLETLARTAVSHAGAGADIVAPSDMMDGRIAHLRKALDQAGAQDTVLLSYAVKYASSLYGPFRDAAGSTPAFGDRRTYQMDPANLREAVREARLDVEQGADLILVKPALAYGDVISAVRSSVDVPVGCYAVSGEYAMIKAASAKGWIDERRVVLETHLSYKRAGAAFMITYWCRQISGWLAR